MTKATKKKPTKAEMRVQIAKDVIKQLREGKTSAEHVYFIQRGLESGAPGKELRDLMADAEEPCEACAIGALFAADVRRYDNFKIQDGFTERICVVKYDIAGKLTYFSRPQLELIEECFEEYIDMDCESPDTAQLYARRHGEDAVRMTAIMKNIIKNGGTFRPAAELKELKEKGK